MPRFLPREFAGWWTSFTPLGPSTNWRRSTRFSLDDAAYEDVAADQLHRGKEEIKQLLRAAYAWAPDFRLTMKSLIVADDCAATEWVSEGIQTGPIGDDLPASGNSFCVRGASILTFRDGKIASVTDYYDMATFLTQLGGTT